MCLLTFGVTSDKQVSGYTDDMVTLMCSGLKPYSMPIGAPQPVQKVRSAMSDSFNFLRVDDAVQLKAVLGTLTKGRKAEPDSC